MPRQKSSSYNAIHLWLHFHYGNALKCSKCGIAGKKTGRRWSIEWALKPGMEHGRYIERYDALCKSCHRKQDYDDKMKLNFSIGWLKRKNKGMDLRRDARGRLLPVKKYGYKKD